MKIKIKFVKLEAINHQFNSCDIIFFITSREIGIDFSVPQHFRFHENQRIYNYNNRDESEEKWKRFCKRMGKQYTWDNGFW